MKTSPDNGSSSGEDRAFTKVELLVIIAVVGLLAVLRLSAATTALNHAKLIRCASNLRQLGQCSLLYAADNSGKVPPGMAGTWPWDVPVPASDFMMRRGATRDMFYDPGFSEHNLDGNWDYMPFYRLTGYAYTFAATGKLASSEENSTASPFQPGSGGYTNPPTPASQRVLAADATISTTPDRSGNFTSVPGGAQGTVRSPHLDGFAPVGGNVVMLDGHVEWRPFSQMSVRSIGGPAYFWW